MEGLLGVAVLAGCAIYLGRVPAWWQGRWYLNRPRWRRRMYLPAVLAVTALDLAALLEYLSERGAVARSVILLPGWSLVVLAVAFAVLAPLVAVSRVFDFMVPPGLRCSGDRPTSGRGVV